MSYPHTVFLDFASLSPRDLDATGLLAVNPRIVLHDLTAPGEVLEKIQNAVIVISNKVVLDRDLLQSARSLKLVCVAATGINNVDAEAASEAGIAVTNVRNYATRSVAEHVLTLMLALSRNLIAYRSSVQRGDWQRSKQFCLMDHPVMELSGRIFGVVGYGVLGQATAALAQAVGMKIMIANRPGSTERKAGRVMLDELLEQADVLSLHCPLTEETENLVGTAELRKMKPSALLINTARGGIVDEAALLNALQQGWIAGAGVDVLAQEPPRKGSVLLSVDLPGLIVTPHMAWVSRSARQALLDQLANIIREWRREGRIINRVI